MNGIFVLISIQRHEPKGTSSLKMEYYGEVIWTTFPPSLLSLPYLKIIGTTISSILLAPVMNHQPHATSTRTLWMTICILLSDSPLYQSSSHLDQAQGHGRKFV